MTTKEMIAVMQAYEDGKKIQIADKGFKNWGDYGISEPAWDWHRFDYRIKPEEEKPKRMTNRQLNEWLAKGFGEWAEGSRDYSVFCEYVYVTGKEKNTIDEDIFIRPWGSDEWIEPTVDIYNRDCKGVKNE